MIKRYILHFEWCKGYRPRVYLRRTPKHGERGTDGGIAGTFVNCKACDGVGQLFDPDEYPLPEVKPEDTENLILPAEPVQRRRSFWDDTDDEPWHGGKREWP